MCNLCAKCVYVLRRLSTACKSITGVCVGGMIPHGEYALQAQDRGCMCGDISAMQGLHVFVSSMYIIIYETYARERNLHTRACAAGV